MLVRLIEEFSSRYHASNRDRSVAFDPQRNYYVHAVQRAPEMASGFVVLVSDQGEIHWVEARHVRVVSEASLPQAEALLAATVS